MNKRNKNRMQFNNLCSTELRNPVSHLENYCESFKEDLLTLTFLNHKNIY